MTTSENKLLSLLFEDGRVLENIKFFPGDKCASAEELFEDAHEAIRQSLSAGCPSVIPADGAKKMSIGDIVSSI